MCGVCDQSGAIGQLKQLAVQVLIPSWAFSKNDIRFQAKLAGEQAEGGKGAALGQGRQAGEEVQVLLCLHCRSALLPIVCAATKQCWCFDYSCLIVPSPPDEVCVIMPQGAV